MYDMSPGEIARTARHWIVTGVIALALIAAVTVGGWQAGWWFKAHDATRQTQVTMDGLGYQTAETDDLNAQIANVVDTTTSMIGTSGAEYTALHAQRLGDARLACADASQITAIPADEAGWVTANCTAGTLNPASPLLSTQGS